MSVLLLTWYWMRVCLSAPASGQWDLPSDRCRRGDRRRPAHPDGQNDQVSKTGAKVQADDSARSRLVGRGAPELLHGGGAALGADDDLVGAVDRGEGELADRRLVLGQRAHAAAGLHAVRQLYVDAGLDLVVARDVEGDDLGADVGAAVEPRRPAEPRQPDDGQDDREAHGCGAPPPGGSA